MPWFNFGTSKRADTTDNGAAMVDVIGNNSLTSLFNADYITPVQVKEIPAVSASVKFIADTMAMLPVKLYRYDAQKQSTEEVEDQRVTLLNDDTGDLMRAFETKSALIADMLLYGAGYAYIDRKDRLPVGLHYVQHGAVSILKNTDPIFKSATLNVNGKSYNPFDFLILTRNTKDGVTGEGVITQHNTLLTAVYAALVYEKNLNRKGGNKAGFLMSKAKISKNDMTEIKRGWKEVYANSNNEGVLILNDGLTWQSAASSSVEMQLNQNKQTNTAQVTSIFGLNPDIISGKASRDIYESTIKTAILPLVVNFQNILNHALLLESEKSTMYFALDTTKLTEADILTRYNAYEIGLRNNFLQVDEVRYDLDKRPLGVNFVKLGLQDVLLNPNTNTIYTPNTNKTVQMGATTEDNTTAEKTD